MCQPRTSTLGSLWECCRCGYKNNSLEFCRHCNHVVCERLPAPGIDLLVVGCPRSGTKYAARLLQEAGAEVGHEWLFRSGLVSCHMTVEHHRWRVPGYDGRFFNLKHSLFRHVYHQVREPLATISSLRHWVREPWAQLFLQVAEETAGIKVEQPPLDLAMEIYYRWNLAAEAVATHTYRVEDLGPSSPASDMLGQAVRIHVGVEHYAAVPRDVNKTEYRKRPLTWKELAMASRHLAARCQEMGRRYGYRSG